MKNTLLSNLTLGLGFSLASCAGTANVSQTETPSLYTTLITPPQYAGATLQNYKSGDKTYTVTGVASTPANPLLSLEVLVVNKDGTIGTLYIDGLDQQRKQVSLDGKADGAYAHHHELTTAPVYISAEDLQRLNLPSYAVACKALEEAIKQERDATNPRIPLDKFLEKRK